MTSGAGIAIYIDADACPVKQEVYRVAERHGLKVYVVSNSPIAVPRDPLIETRRRRRPAWTRPTTGSPSAPQGASIVITQDIPLAARAVKAGAVAIAPNGKPFTEGSIGMALATRNLMDLLRSAGEITGGPRPFAPKDRSVFLQSLDREIVRLKRAGFGQAHSLRTFARLLHVQ